jgi:hypothetical protein
MFEIFQNASDDQLALIGCAAALLGSGFLMYVSYFMGPMARQEKTRQLELLIDQRKLLLESGSLDPVCDKAA